MAYNNIFDMLQVMCDAAILIADGNWGDTNVAEYVRSRIPNCQHVEGFRDILHPVIERRKKAVEPVQEERKSDDTINVIEELFLARDKKGLENIRGQIHAQIHVASSNIYDLGLNAKGMEILGKSDQVAKCQDEMAINSQLKRELEALDNKVIKLMNLIS